MTRAIGERRWRLAQEHQRDDQRIKAEAIRGRERELCTKALLHAQGVRDQIAPFLTISESTQILEVGSGPHGISFFLPAGERYALDPLAETYRQTFSSIQAGSGARAVAGVGEAIPFDEARFDLVISDNVLDHTRDPAAVLAEICRVLRPGGVLFLAVNVHRAAGHLLSLIHERTIGQLGLAMRQFGSHPFFFRYQDLTDLLERLPLDLLVTRRGEDSRADRPAAVSVGALARQGWRRLFQTTRCTMICRRAS